MESWIQIWTFATQDWNSKDEPWKWTVELLFAELIAQCDGHAEIWHYGVTEDLCTMLYTIFSFSKPWPYSFSHALNDLRSGHFTPKHLITSELSITVFRTSLPCLKKKPPLYTLYISRFCSVCFSFYFQRCPVWLHWPQYYHLANIFCPDATNKVDISDSFSFSEETAVHHLNPSQRDTKTFCLGGDKLTMQLNTRHSRHHNTTRILPQKLLTIYSVFLASLLSSPKVSKNCSISLCSVALRSSAAARARSDSTILPWMTWYQCRCCARFVFSRTTSTCSSSFLCSRLMFKTQEGWQKDRKRNG